MLYHSTTVNWADGSAANTDNGNVAISESAISVAKANEQIFLISVNLITF